MTNKEKLHQILSSLWKNDDSIGKTYYNQALQDVQTAIDWQEEPVSEEFLNKIKEATSVNWHKWWKGVNQEEKERQVKDYAKTILSIAKAIDYPNPVSEDLDKVALKYANKQLMEAGVTDENCPREWAVAQASLMVSGFKAGAEWQKEYMMKEIKIRLIDAATNQDNSTDIGEQTYYNGMVDALGRLRDKFMEG